MILLKIILHLKLKAYTFRFISTDSTRAVKVPASQVKISANRNAYDIFLDNGFGTVLFSRVEYQFGHFIGNCMWSLCIVLHCI